MGKINYAHSTSHHHSLLLLSPPPPPPPPPPPKIPEYCQRLDEQDVLDNAFDIIFAFDEIVALGYRENVNLAQIRTFTEMDSHEEKVYEAMRKVGGVRGEREGEGQGGRGEGEGRSDGRGGFHLF